MTRYFSNSDSAYALAYSAVLHALLIHDIATDGKLAYDVGAPLAELRGADGIDAITYGDDGIKVVELCKIVFPVSSSCRDFLGN